METQNSKRKSSFRLPLLSPRSAEARNQFARSTIKPQHDPFFRISKGSKFRLSPVTPNENPLSKQSPTPDPTLRVPFTHSIIKLQRSARRHMPTQRMSLMIPEVAGIEVAETNSLDGPQTIVKAKIIQRGGSTDTLGFLSNKRAARLGLQGKKN